MTLTRFVLARQRAHPEASGDFTQLVSAIATACKAISAAVRKAGLVGLFGLQGGAANASGDAQKKLDVIANDIVGRERRGERRASAAASAARALRERCASAARAPRG
jgi:fructose-1,6-bisphosphatase I